MKILMVSDKVATVQGKPLKRDCTPTLTLGTIGCGSLFSFMDGEMLDLGDGDTSETLSFGNVTVELNPLAEVNYNAE